MSQFYSEEIVADSSIEDIIKKEEFLQMPLQIFNPYRLLILFALSKWGALDFSSLRDGIKIKSDGNLANHLKMLEDSGLIIYRKEFVDRRPKTFYELTSSGKEIMARLAFIMSDFLKDISFKNESTR